MDEISLKQALELSLETVTSPDKRGMYTNAFNNAVDAGFDPDGPVSQINNRKAVDLFDSKGMDAGRHGALRRFINIANEKLENPKGNVYNNKEVKKLTKLDLVGKPKAYKLVSVADKGFSNYTKTINDTIAELEYVANTGRGTLVKGEESNIYKNLRRSITNSDTLTKAQAELLKNKASSLKTWIVMKSSTGVRQEALMNLTKHNYDASEGKIYDAIKKARGAGYIPVSYDLGEYHQKIMQKQIGLAQGKDWAGGAFIHKARRMNDIMEKILQPEFKKNGVVWKDPFGKPQVFKTGMLRNQFAKTAISLYGINRGKQLLGHVSHDTILTHYAGGKGLSAFDVAEIKTSTGTSGVSQAGDLDNYIKTIVSEAQGNSVIDMGKTHGIDMTGTALANEPSIDSKQLQEIKTKLSTKDKMLNIQVSETVNAIDTNTAPNNIENYVDNVNEAVDNIRTDDVIPEKKTPYKKESLQAIKDLFSKFGKNARQAVGDISDYVDESVDAEATRMDAQIEAMKGMPPGQRFLTGVAGAVSLIPTRKVGVGAVKLVGNMLSPSRGTVGRGEATLESMATLEQDSGAAEMKSSLAAAQERKEEAQSLADIEYDMQQNPSQIGDNQVETNDDRINRQMLEAGFGS
tara:strand:- start:646 stop:2541 length:1896 start_codon:yes stop_codon:yes gene_type:complete